MATTETPDRENKPIIWADLSPDERTEILEQHRLWVRGKGGRRADLSRAYLSGAYLSGADLGGAYLGGADLSRALLKDDLKIEDIYQCGPQGSRNAYLVAYLCDDGKTYFSTGCEHGIEKAQFLKKVRETHGDSAYGNQYKAAVAHCAKMLALLKEGDES